MRAWARGKVALANAPGAGVADDKLVYTYVPDMIRYYLDETPILPNVPSWRCREKKELDHVLSHLESLVVKPVDGSGGYGMLMGHQSRMNPFRHRSSYRALMDLPLAQRVRALRDPGVATWRGGHASGGAGRGAL